jgi:hypothetical protein
VAQYAELQGEGETGFGGPAAGDGIPVFGAQGIMADEGVLGIRQGQQGGPLGIGQGQAGRHGMVPLREGRGAFTKGLP